MKHILRNKATHLMASIAVAGVVALGTATSTIAADVTLKLAAPHSPEQQAGKLLEVFAAEIEAANVGIDVKVYLAGVLGSGEELMEDTIRGNVDMSFAFIYANKAPVLEINSLPYLVATADDMRNTFLNPDSAFRQIMGDALEGIGLKLLATSAEGFVGVVSTVRPDDPTGMGDKGTNIRVWNSNLVKMTVEAIGYRTTTMNWAEVFSAIQVGTVDGAICCTPITTYDVFTTSQVGKYFIPLHSFSESSSLYMNLGAWNSLNAKQQAVVQSAASKLASELMEWSMENEAAYMDKIREAGWEVLELTDEEHAAQAAHIRKVIWPQLADTIGQDVLDKLSK